MRLQDHNWPAKVVKSGAAEAVAVPVGKALKIETFPAGQEVLNAVCPAGKVWTARVIVEITETDA